MLNLKPLKKLQTLLNQVILFLESDTLKQTLLRLPESRRKEFIGKIDSTIRRVADYPQIQRGLEEIPRQINLWFDLQTLHNEWDCRSRKNEE